jgi:ABC-type Mn2+/Zn2+ transport system permease subunit
MKKYTMYFWSLIIVSVLSLVGTVLSYMYTNPDAGALIVATLVISFIAIVLMPDEDKYRSVD